MALSRNAGQEWRKILNGTHPRPTIGALLGCAVGLFWLFFGFLYPVWVAAQAAPPGWASTIYLPLTLQQDGLATISRSVASAPIAVSPDDSTVWVANPDAASVSVIDAGSLTKTHEIPVGQAPWSLAIAPAGDRVYVANRTGGSLSIIDARRRELLQTIALGPELGGIALNPQGTLAYLTVTTADQVIVFDTEHLTITAAIPVAPLPSALAVTSGIDADETDERIVVTHLLALPRPGGGEATDDGRQGLVTVIDSSTGSVSAEIALAPDEHGFPNLLAGLALVGNRVWVPHVRAAPALPNGLTTTVFAGVAALDLGEQREVPSAALHLNDADTFGSPVNNPVAVVPAPDGKTLYVVAAGSDLVEIVDVAHPAQPRLIGFLPTGANPRGMALDAGGRRGYVMNYLARSVTVLDLVNLQVDAEIPVTAETLDAETLRGKILFHKATDPRLSKGSWISCASCHPDGGSDGVTWFFPDGPRQTPPLWNAGVTLPWHWSAALDEPQDVEETIHLIQRGLGLAPGLDPPLLGAPNAGRSADLDALAAFIVRGITAPAVRSPTPEATEGRRLLEEAGCATCHGGPHWTISALPGPAGTLDPDGNGMVDEVLREVGTLHPLDVRGATGFDVPSLLGVGLTAPYLHDGSMPTLEALLASGHPDPQGAGNGLSEAEIVMVSSFLRSIDATTAPFTAQR